MTESVWLREPRPRREGPPLTRERIVAEAVALLDAEGAGRLTMRRLAERLGTGSTTLYWHVTTKGDVLDLALDAIFGDVPLPSPGAGWRADVISLLAGWRAAMLGHPWSAAVLGGRRLLGPNVLARTDFLYSALERAGMAGPHIPGAAAALADYVIGSALMEVGARGGDEPEARRAADAHVAGHRDRYPSLAAHGHLGDDGWDAAFTQGLGYLLDGMAASLGRPG